MSIKAKSCFEFTLQDFSQLPSKVYSPPFATTHDIFWQLKFKPTSQDSPDHCSIYLIAIPNKEEVNTTSSWPRRAEVCADIYLKNPRTFLVIKKMSLDTSKFSAIKPLRGWNRFCKRSLLQYDEVILGVEFDLTEFQPNDRKPCFPGNAKSFPTDLIQAWGEQLNNVETADVEFRVQGQGIFANTAILSRRSEYFKRMFEGKWIESIAYNQKDPQKQHRLKTQFNLPITSSMDSELQSLSQPTQEQFPIQSKSSSLTSLSCMQHQFPLHKLPTVLQEENLDPEPFLQPHKRKRLDESRGFEVITTNNHDDTLGATVNLIRKPHERIVISVTDFHPETFIEMLRYLYTNEVAFGREDTHRSAVDIYKIADKYLIETLQQIAKVKLCKSVNISNAAEFLFGTAWQYEELKEHVMSYVVQNFKSVQKTTGWMNITRNPVEYPYFGDLLNEILRLVLTDGDSEYSDS
ncbi:hypothetical protein G9A89_009832 [Geosiphon pyriformis]|nr:hypothetical protein G9A89_009832 [Geosiphon pyriformis]